MADYSKPKAATEPVATKSFTSFSHREVVDIVARWCLNQGYPIILAEFVSYHDEICDVLGLRASDSLMIEVKVSRADFLRDKKKHFRYYEAAGVGNFRYYCTPKGLIDERELPDGWGLIEVYPSGKARKSVWALRKNTNHKGERNILYSYARRAVYKGFHDAIVRPQSQEEVIDLANTSPDTNKSVSNPPDNATLSNLEGRDGDSA